MKNLVLIFSLLMVSGIYAQEKVPVDKMETTKTTTTSVKKNGQKEVLSKVKETTRKEQEVKTEQHDGKTVNGYKVDTPIKVTQTIEVNSQWDPFYDSNEKKYNYMMNGEQMTFNSNLSGFIIESSDMTTYGEARKSSKNHLYLTDTKGHPGVGYFDNDGRFIVEYYDKQKNLMVTEIYELNQ